jgi:hypothetical protein
MDPLEMLERIQSDAERIQALEQALEVAITHIESLMGSDADDSQDVAWLRTVLDCDWDDDTDRDFG